MKSPSDPFAGKTDQELRGLTKSYAAILATLGVIATSYAGFLLYSAASGNWSWRMGAAVVPLLGLLVATIFPMNGLAAAQQELGRRRGQGKR